MFSSSSSSLVPFPDIPYDIGTEIKEIAVDKSLQLVSKQASTSILTAAGGLCGSAIGGPIVGSASAIALPLVAGDYVADGIKTGLKQVIKIVRQ